MKLYSIIIFILFLSVPFISNAQDKCKTDYTCRDSPYCGDDMTCFCSNGVCTYGPGPVISKNNTNVTFSFRGSHIINSNISK